MTSSALQNKLHDEESPTIVCGFACEYDDWFNRAKCDNRGLQVIPNATGCEETRILELEANGITSITFEFISSYRNIVTLDLSRNSIASLQPGTFESTIYLENIIFSRNQLTKLENGTFRGPEHHLVRLFLDDNRLIEVHGLVLHGLRKLQTLTFSHNLIHYLPDNLFNDLADLRYLHLSGNKLTYLDGNIFSGLSKLKSISLNRNHLGSIPAGVFDGLTSLNSVDLSNNHLYSIPQPTDLGLLHGLQSIYLNENVFTISNLIIPFLNTSDILIIGGNPFLCDCTFIQVQTWFLGKSKDDQTFLLRRSSLGCWWDDRFIDIYGDLSETCQDSSENRQISTPPGGSDESSVSLNYRYRDRENYRLLKTLSNLSPVVSSYDVNPTPRTPQSFDAGCMNNNDKRIFILILITFITIISLSLYIIFISLIYFCTQNKYRKPGYT
ncbi:putative chondroadherin-like protein isoform X1 [Apostichopus japonicus]|uniref:Putative chondroadherin-like protein isoform X1 n=1 Tax=Stichopus japonicus TaxID=307972 RepID=A0A2G8K1K8_STIJA|nr:putative chondroadherin-like protein isoform X1 [Apostichopus japonicus]